MGQKFKQIAMKIQRFLKNSVFSAFSKSSTKEGVFEYKKTHQGRGVNFYFGLACLVLFGLLFFSSDSLAEPNYNKGNDIVFFNSFFKDGSNDATTNDLFFSPDQKLALETPDLKIIQDNSIDAISTPTVLTTQTLGDIFGGSNDTRKDVVDYTVQPGDTVDSVAANYNISANTVAWANNISRTTTLKTGQTLVILPVSGISYIVKNGDTLGQIAKIYKANVDTIIAFNSLSGQNDIFIGDSLIIPDGQMPVRAQGSISIQVPLADNFFIYPAEGIITQGLHYYNAIDLANQCGTSIYAAAAGTVQRAIGNGGWNLGMGNYITILHSNGTVTYYGHLMTLFVKPGDKVDVGDRIGLMGRTGDATGCHVHFEVVGAQNPLARYSVGTKIRYTSK